MTTALPLNPIWNRTFALLVAIALLAGLVYAIAGWTDALACFGICLLFLYLRDRYHLRSLWQWVASGLNDRPPLARGAWEHLLAILYKQHRREQHHNEVLNEALHRFQGAAQALPDGVITLNNENQIIWFNAQAAEHYGLRHPADNGQNITNLLRAPDFLAYLNQTEWDAPLIIRLRAAPPGTPGSDRTLSLLDRVLSIQLVGYGNQQKLLLSRDVTKIEKLETMRRDFVANVSHELKTPLTVLSGFLETIREFKPPPKQQEHYLALMSEQAGRMERLVADLLTLSSLESNNSPLDEVVNMAQLLAQIEQTATQLSAGQHTITFELEPGLKLLGAEAELASALTNLVTNAVRYTPAGGSIRVSWKSGQAGSKATDAVQEDEVARFSVQDSGIGIPAQHIPRLTERFYRVDRGRSRESGGTGLGLAIVKHVLTRHQARLEIESTVGAGSCFTALFPARRLVHEAVVHEAVVSKAA